MVVQVPILRRVYEIIIDIIEILWKYLMLFHEK